MEEELVGLMGVTLAAVFWSVSPAMISMVMRGTERNSLYANAIRNAAALPVLGITAYIAGFKAIFTPISIGLLLATTLIGPGLGDYVYTEAIRLTGASLATPIGYLYILVAQLIAWRMGEHATLRLFLGGVLAIIGVWLVSEAWSHGGEASLRGVVLAGVSALSWGISTVIMKLLLSYMGVVELVFYRVLILAPLLYALYKATGSSEPLDLRGILILGFSGILTYGAGLPLFTFAIKIVGVGYSVLPTALTPVLTQLTAAYMAGERLSSCRVVGSIITVAGIIVGVS